MGEPVCVAVPQDCDFCKADAVDYPCSNCDDLCRMLGDQLRNPSFHELWHRIRARERSESTLGTRADDRPTRPADPDCEQCGQAKAAHGGATGTGNCPGQTGRKLWRYRAPGANKLVTRSFSGTSSEPFSGEQSGDPSSATDEPPSAVLSETSPADGPSDLESRND